MGLQRVRHGLGTNTFIIFTFNAQQMSLSLSRIIPSYYESFLKNSLIIAHNLLNLERQNINIHMFYTIDFETFHRDTHPEHMHTCVYISSQNEELEETVQNTFSAYL